MNIFKLGTLCLICFFNVSLLTSYIQAYHSEEYKGEVNNLALEILLMEQEGTEEERNNHAAAAYHRHNAYQRARKS